MTFIYILLATSIISLISIVGVFTLYFHPKVLKGKLVLLISLAAGSLMGGAFFHLLPEAGKNLAPDNLYIGVIVAFVIFLLIEKVLNWRHCHEHNCEVHTLGYMSIIGDSIHNFLDGLIVAAAFVSDTRLGMITAFAMVLHEIPQEIGDFGVLLHAGFKKKTALIINFLSALTAIFGAIVGYFISSSSQEFIPYLLPFAAGGFIYIAASDLLPEMRKEKDHTKTILSFTFFLTGIVIMYLLKYLEI